MHFHNQIVEYEKCIVNATDSEEVAGDTDVSAVSTDTGTSDVISGLHSTAA